MTSVVIVGSGFTGFECARRLSRTLSRHHLDAASVDISIISPVDYMLYTPLLPDVAGGVVDARFVAIPGNNFLSNTWRERSEADTNHALERTALGFLGRMAGNTFEEFWPDVKQKIFHRH